MLYETCVKNKYKQKARLSPGFSISLTACTFRIAAWLLILHAANAAVLTCLTRALAHLRHNQRRFAAALGIAASLLIVRVAAGITASTAVARIALLTVAAALLACG